MGRKYKIISGDGHVETPPESWVKYMPEEHQDRAPRLVKLAKGGDAHSLSKGLGEVDLLE